MNAPLRHFGPESPASSSPVHPPRAFPTLIAVPDRIDGERVVLRPWAPADAKALFETVNRSREHLLPRLPWADSAHRTLDDTADFIVRTSTWWALRTNLIVGIFDRATGGVLGGSGLHACRGTEIDWSIPALMIGYWIAKEHEGKGYVAEAVRLLTRVAFDDLHANRLEVRCDADNVRSVNVMERAGFVREACLRRDGRTPAGTLRDTLVYSMVPSDYASLRRS